MADLVVELYRARVGVLAGTWRAFDFLPDPAAVARFGIDSPILSVQPGQFALDAPVPQRGLPLASCSTSARTWAGTSGRPAA
jgi:hypothetical protein